MALDYKKLSDDRRAALNEIRLLLKREFPDAFSGHFQPSIVEALTNLLRNAKAVERGRDAFRDELIRLGYDHDALVRLTEEK